MGGLTLRHPPTVSVNINYQMILLGYFTVRLTVGGVGGFNPYGHPDRKISVCLRLPNSIWNNFVTFSCLLYPNTLGVIVLAQYESSCWVWWLWLWQSMATRCPPTISGCFSRWGRCRPHIWHTWTGAKNEEDVIEHTSSIQFLVWKDISFFPLTFKQTNLGVS